MKIKIIIYLLLLPALAFAQKTDTLLHKLDSLDKKADTVSQKNSINPRAYNEATEITFKSYFILLGSDFKQQLTAPFNSSKKDWARVAKFGLLAGGLMFLDHPIQRKAVTWRKDNAFLTNASKYITNTGGAYETITLATLGAYGYLFKDVKIRTTTLLASQAYITSEVINTVLKNLAGRQRPSVYNPDKVESRPVFKGPLANGGKDLNGKKLATSFPSGHATLAFSAATVYAMEYKDKPLIPILAYTGATMIGLSRITENQHWFTDVFIGATLGYLSGRQVVNNYHRFAKIKKDEPANHQALKSRLFFNMQNYNGELHPGLTLSLRN
jgi:membrane-associated phospholipid phosphatase